MKTSTLLACAVVICAITMLAFVGVSAFTEGDPSQTLLLFIGVMTPVVTTILTLLRGERTLEVSKNTDTKVDALLNGSLVGKVAALDERVGNIEIVTTKILAKLENSSP